MIRPASGRVLLKPVETAESVPGGRIILVQQARDEFAKWQYEVVAVGREERCDDEDCDRHHGVFPNGYHPVDHRLVPGAWCIIEPRSLMDACVDGEKFYYVRQAAIVGVFVESDAEPLAVEHGNRSLEERHAKERRKQIARDHAYNLGESAYFNEDDYE